MPVTSSTEPDWPQDAQDCYRGTLQALREIDVPFAVGGAFAIHKHTGIWRETKDLDFLLAPAEVPKALQWLQQKGYETWIEDPVWLAKARRGDYFVDLITGIGNASLSVDASWIERSTPEIVLGIPCRVLAPEECIASKIFVAYRERFDGADVVHLILACGPTLDWARLLQLIDSHWELLYWSLILFAYVYPARTGAVPNAVWDDLSSRFSEKIRHPAKDAPFRGSLVDPRMFAIDVEEWGERNLYQEYCERHPCLLRLADSIGSKE